MNAEKINIHRAAIPALLLLLSIVLAFAGCSRSSVGSFGGSLPGGQSGWSGAPGGDLLWSTEDLLGAMNNPDLELVVVDCRADVADYDAGHIDGAIWIDWKELSNALHTALPATADVETFLGQKRGIERTDTICLYGGSIDDMYNTHFRLFWMLEHYGCPSVHVLNGGYREWTKRDLPVSTQKWANVTITPAVFTADITGAVLADRAEVAAIVSDFDRATQAIVDARSAAEFKGEAAMYIQDRAGSIPGAGNAFWRDCFDAETGLILDPGAVRPLVEEAGAFPGRQITLYSTAGVRSTVLYFVCRLFGYPSQVYLAGLQDWCDVDVAEPLYVKRSGSYVFKSMGNKDGNATFAGASTVLGGQVFIFGGLHTPASAQVAEIHDGAWRFDPAKHPRHEGQDKDCWTSLNVPGGVPRWAHMAVADPAGDAIYIFGGRGPDKGTKDTIARVDIDPVTLDVTGMTVLGLKIPESLAGSASVLNPADGLIYLIGGFGPGQDGKATDAVFAFTPSSQGPVAITRLASLPSPRAWSGAVALDGKIYCFGGEDDDGNLLDEMLEFDPATGKWGALAPMRTARMAAGGAVAHGRIHVTGGYIENLSGGERFASGLTESFDPSSAADGWRLEEMMEVSKYWHFAESVNDRIYLIGGYDGTPKALMNRIAFANVVEYGPVLRAERSALPGDPRCAGATAEINNRIYLFGGNAEGTLTDEVLEYDVAGDIWNAIDTLPQGAITGASAVAANGRALVFGGAGEQGVSRETWLFDPAAPAGSRWVRKADMPEDRWAASAVRFDDSLTQYFPGLGSQIVFVLGGKDLNELAWSTTLIYDFSSDTWVPSGFEPLPVPKSCAGAAIVGDRIFSTGGIDDAGRPLDECLVLDLSGLLFDWTKAGPLPTARYGHGCAVIGDRIVVAGGFVDEPGLETVATDRVEVLDAAGASWRSRAALAEPVGFSYIAPTASGSILVIGGLDIDPDNFPHMIFSGRVLEYRP